jgi:hypothetical protein
MPDAKRDDEKYGMRLPTALSRKVGFWFVAPKYATLVFLKQKRPVPTSWTADRVIFAGVLLIGLWIVVAMGRTSHRPDRCPIDGRVADWTKRSGENSCDYGHSSGAGRAIHKWSAACP